MRPIAASDWTDRGNCMKGRLPLTAAVVVLAACGNQENPLLAASDAQFAQLIERKNAFSASCAAALYESDLFIRQYNGLKFSAAEKIAAVSERQKAGCIVELQKRAAESGIRGNVTREHLLDERVRQRYFAARKG